MTVDPSSARTTLQHAAESGNVGLDQVVSAADVLSGAATSNDDRMLVARALRASVARGLDEGEADRVDALATYARLAVRFRAWIDVWNAASLAARLGATDQELRALRTVAFVHVFDDVARERPQLVQALMGPVPDARWGTFVLLRWLDRVAETIDPTRGAVALASALHSVLACRDAWLNDRTGADVDRAWSDLAVDLARHAVAPIPASPAWARVMTRAARLLAGRLDAASREEDAESETTAGPGTTAPPANSASLAPSGDVPDEIVRSAAAAIERDRMRIWVVGAHAARHHLEGIAKEQGFEKPSDVFAFLDYHDLKSKSLPAAIDPARDVGVILGAVPHKVKDVGSHSSLATALVEDFGLDVVPVRENSTSAALVKITKSQFRKALRHLLASAAPPLVEGTAA